MATPRRIGPEEASAYLVLRNEMLLDAPWAFLSSPDDDAASAAPSLAETLRDPENAIFAIDDAGEPSRFVAAAAVFRSRRAKTRHRANIWGVYVTPRARGRGLGRAVLDAAIEQARRWPGVEIIGLCVSERSGAAVSLYRSLGFEQWGAEPDAMRSDGEMLTDLHMQLHL